MRLAVLLLAATIAWTPLAFTQAPAPAAEVAAASIPAEEEALEDRIR